MKDIKVDKRKYKTKNSSTVLFTIDNRNLSFVTQLICNCDNDIRISCFLTYNKHRIHPGTYINTIEKYKTKNMARIKKNMMHNSLESKVRIEMNKNHSISTKELAKLTGESLYLVKRVYMKIRRENGIIRN